MTLGLLVSSEMRRHLHILQFSLSVNILHVAAILHTFLLNISQYSSSLHFSPCFQFEKPKDSQMVRIINAKTYECLNTTVISLCLPVELLCYLAGALGR